MISNHLHSQIPIHGHRGTRGWAPENSLFAFKEACKQQADFLELDIVMTADSQLLINHEPYLNKRFQKNGTKILKFPKSYFYQESFGNTDQKKYPFQQKSFNFMPTMSELVREIEKYCNENQLKMPAWNIEIKSVPFHHKYYPPRKKYAKLLLEELNRLNLKVKGFIQSFDRKLLEEMYALDSSWKYAWLLLKPGKLKKRVKKAKMKLWALNPNGILLKKKFIDDAKAADIQVIPWTVNSPKEMKRLISIGVNGLITDYPLRAKMIQNPNNENALDLSQKMLKESKQNWISTWTKLECIDPEQINNMTNDQKLHFWSNIYYSATLGMLAFQNKIYPDSKFYIAQKAVSLKEIKEKYIFVKKNDKRDLFQADSTKLAYIFLQYLEKFPTVEFTEMNNWMNQVYKQWFEKEVQYLATEHRIIFPKKSKILFKSVEKREILMLSLKYLKIDPNKKVLPRISFAKK